MPVAKEESYFLPRKAGLIRPCGRAAFRSGSSGSFRPFPGADSCEAKFLKSTLAGGVWQRLLRSRVRLPLGAQAPVVQWTEQRATCRRRLFPGQNIYGRCQNRARQDNHPGRWCRSRILLKPLVAGSTPARSASSSSSEAEQRNSATACSPAGTFSGVAQLARPNNHFGRWRRQRVLRLISRRRGFDSRTGCKFRKLCGQSAVISLLPLVPRPEIFASVR